MKAGLFLIVLSLAGQAPPQVPAPSVSEPEPFVLGVLRRDGIVSPFAVFDGKEWAQPWPTDLRYLDLPISLEAVPRKWWGKASPPEDMSVWVAGAKRGTLRVERPTTLRVMCSSRFTLRSNYRPSEPPPPPMEQPYPKDGLVVSGNQVIHAIEIVPHTSADWVPAALSLLEPFELAERRALSAFTRWKHPIPRAERRKVPLELEALYKAPMDAPGWVAYYFEAVKRYAPGPGDGGCGLVTAVTGWMAVAPDGKRSTQSNARVTYCDREDDIYMLPLGLITTGGSTYWVYQLSGYVREGYAVVRPTPKLIEPKIQYPAGSCER